MLWRKTMKPAALIAVVSALFVLLSPPSALADPAGEGEGPLLIHSGDKGDNVIMLQMRLADLGYFDTTITGIFGDVTAEAVKKFQKENNLTADGVVGEQTSLVLFSNDAVREPIVAVKKPVNNAPKKKSNVPTGHLRDWFSYVNARWQRGEKCLVYDYATGATYYMIRVGGSLHADVEPATKDDCVKFFKTYGNSWSWDRRAVVVKIDGEYIAGSTNGFPHGYETVGGNNMNGQVCIHFLNSQNHVHDMVDPSHQAMVRRAAGK